MRHKWFILGQAIFVILILIVVFVLYPRAKVEVDGNKVSFSAINANAVILSASPDFSNARVIDLNETVSFNLKPGRYYWKASNGIIESFSDEFSIDSDVGLKIIEKNGKEELKNVGNVKVNVTRTVNGTFIGHIILEPVDSEEINEGEYLGRQENG